MNSLTRWRLGELSNSEYLAELIEAIAEVQQAMANAEAKEGDARWASFAPKE